MLSSLCRALPPLACLAFAAALAAQLPAPAPAEPHFPTTDDLRHLKVLAAPLLSPDGKQALFTVTEATSDGARAHLWLVPTAGTEPARQLTFSVPADKRGERSPAWAPDGSALYFLAHRGERTQLFRLDLRGGEAQPYDLKIPPAVDDSKDPGAIPPAAAEKADKALDFPSSDRPDTSAAGKDGKKDEKKEEKKPEPLPIEVASFAISPDGHWLALIARDPETPGEKKAKDAKADAEWVNHETHRSRLYLAALKPDGQINGGLAPVTLSDDVHTAVWSPLSDRLVALAQAPNDLSDLGPAGSAWLVTPSQPAAPARLAALPPTAHAAAFSADGTTLVFLAQTPEDAPPGYNELFAVPVAGGTPRRLSAGFKGQLASPEFYFTASGDMLTQAAIGTHSAVVRVALLGASAPSPAVVDLGSPYIGALNTNRAQSGWLWLAESGGQPTRLCYAVQIGSPCAALPVPPLAPAGLRSAEPEVIHWQSGPFTVEGLLYLPPVPAGAKVPLVVDVHGGPFGAFADRNDAYAAFLLGHGWAVLRPNPRGSSNYGVAFAAANKNDLGGGDYQDIMAGVDYALAHYPLDPARTALMGYSYGGEMAAFVEGKTTRFKAVISEAPVIDQLSEYGTESGSWYDRWYFGKPWEHLQDAWRQSPLAGAAKAKTPFLLIQGQADTTDPLGQSQEMYRALRQEGVPVELVTYPRENHGPLATGVFGRPSAEPWHGYDARQRIVAFLQKAFAGQ